MENNYSEIDGDGIGRESELSYLDMSPAQLEDVGMTFDVEDSPEDYCLDAYHESLTDLGDFE